MDLHIRQLAAHDWCRIAPSAQTPDPAVLAAEQEYGCIGYEVCLGSVLGRVLLIPATAVPEFPSHGARSAFVVVQARGNRAAVGLAFQRVLVTAVRHGITTLDGLAAPGTASAIWLSSRDRLIDLDFTVVSATPQGTHMYFEMRRLAGLERIGASVSQVASLLRPQRLPQAHATRIRS